MMSAQIGLCLHVFRLVMTENRDHFYVWSKHAKLHLQNGVFLGFFLAERVLKLTFCHPPDIKEGLKANSSDLLMCFHNIGGHARDSFLKKNGQN